jgi:hypothetical protein
MQYRAWVKVILWCVIFCFSFVPVSVFSQSNTSGHIFGQVRLESGQPASNATITIVNAQTGQQRTLSARANGSFRFPALPIGTYSILIEAQDYISSEHAALTVNVGVGTIVNSTLLRTQEEVLVLGALSVYGGKISPIDISSTESSTILSMETIERLPVARNPGAVCSPARARHNPGGSGFRRWQIGVFWWRFRC